MKRPAFDPEDLKYCNCAQCGAELLGESRCNVERAMLWYSPTDFPPVVAGRVLGRPYCRACLSPKRPPPPWRGTKDDESPWGENAVRHLEDGGESCPS